MTITDDDKSWLIEAIGNIVAAAVTTLERGQAEHSRRLTLIEQGIAHLKQGQADLDSRLVDLQIDVQDTKRHVANVSRDRMVAGAREQKNDARLTTVEATVAELKVWIESGEEPG